VQARNKKKALEPPVPPDESKWDIIYCLPFFGKPGKHSYLIKYKNSNDKSQARLIKKKAKALEDLKVTQSKMERTNLELSLQTI